MEPTVLRKPSPNEKRQIVRHNIGFYNNLVVGAIYSLSRDSVQESDLGQLDLYAPALIECIKQHPFLSVTIRDAESKDSIYVRPNQLNLRNHYRILALRPSHASDESAILRQAIEQLHNDAESVFRDIASTPAWAIDVLPLPTPAKSSHYRVFLSFTYAHSHGDGLSGIAFHQTFYAALQRTLQSSKHIVEKTVKTPDVPLPDQPDTSVTMPISWSYLLAPALATYLPTFLSSLLGISGDVSGTDDGTWRGSDIFVDTRTPGVRATTSVEFITIRAPTLKAVLAGCRRKEVKLTALLSQIIVQAMSTTLDSHGTRSAKHTNFVSAVPYNFRRQLGVSPSTFGNYGAGTYLRHDVDADAAAFDDDTWQHIRAQGQKLAQDASNLHNQPLGLFRYVSDFAVWMQSKIGHARDSSWQVSNLGVFDPNDSAEDNQQFRLVNVEQVFFSQPASPVGSPLDFNVVSLKDGALNICISWQIGSLGLPKKDGDEAEEAQDRGFVQQVAAFLKDRLEQLEYM